MTPREFEAFVAAALEDEGYQTELTPSTNDWGVDIFATRGKERLAVQVKMYGGGRPVNRQMVFELYGAAAYFGCTGAAIATDGQFRPDAAAAAAKLGIRVIDHGFDEQRPSRRPSPLATSEPSAQGVETDFDTIWSHYIMPLAGRTVRGGGGLANEIVAVDWSGVRRVTSTGSLGSIPIEPFRWAIERILEVGAVSRQEINEQYVGRASSGIQLILEQVPLFEVSGRPAAIRLRKDRPANKGPMSSG